jgi:hypothetical protein
LRKQYHFRPSTDGLFAWDVHRLIELSKDLVPQDISLNSISELRENYWFQNKEDSPSCLAIAEHCRLIEETDLRYPIILSANGRIMDGMHRVCKAYIEGKKTIKAVQFLVDPEADFKDVKDPDDLPYR